MVDYTFKFNPSDTLMLADNALNTPVTIKKSNETTYFQTSTPAFKDFTKFFQSHLLVTVVTK